MKAYKFLVSSAGAAVAAWVALGISGWNMYQLSSKAPDTNISFGPYAYFLGTGPDLIGLQCSFVNEGASHDIINFMTASIEGANQVLRCIWVAVGRHQWVLKEHLVEDYTREMELADFGPILVPPNGRESRIVWFRSDTGYRFQPGKHTITVRAYGSSPDDSRAQGSLEFSLSQAKLDSLRQNPHIEVSVRIMPWVGLPGTM